MEVSCYRLAPSKSPGRRDRVMRAKENAETTQDELFAAIVRARGAGRRYDAELGSLVELWKRPALYVVRRIQASYRRRASEDEEEIFQDAVIKFVEKGLDQFRGLSEQMPGKAASPRTFFLRIVKHVAIDRYRRQREVLAEATVDDEPTEGERVERRQAVEAARARDERESATELYWRAFARLREEHPNEAGAWELYHHQDLEDHQACAEQLGITVANSYKRVSRAQAYLKVYLLELEQEPLGRSTDDSEEEAGT